MKRTLLLSLLGFTMAAQAQHASWMPMDTKTEKGKHLAALLSQQADQNANKTTTIKQRVITSVFYSLSNGNTLQVSDSYSYSYTGNNKSSFDYNMFNYADFDEAPNVKYTQKIHYTGSYSAPYTPYISEKNIAHYNAAGKPDTNLVMTPDFSGTVFENDERYDYVYNAQGKLQTKFIDQWDDSLNKYVPYEKKTCFYNTAGLLAADTTYYIDTTYGRYDSANVYTYNSAGKELTRYNLVYDYFNSGWDTGYSTRSSYYSSNYVKTYAYTQYNGGGNGSYTSTDSFGYGSSNLFNYYASFDNSGFYPASTKLTEGFRHFNSAGMPDTITFSYYNGVPKRDSAKYLYYINSYNNPDSIVGYIVHGGIIRKDSAAGKMKNRYETYNDLAVADTKIENTILLYPNPANDAISLRRDYNFGNRETAIVWNAAGQKMIEQGLGSNKSTNIDINRLTSGIYWLLVQDAQGGVVGKQSFVKK